MQCTPRRRGQLCNGRIACRTMCSRLQKNDILCVSPYTFSASAAVALHIGMHIQFVDIEEEGYNIDCDMLEHAIQNIRAQHTSHTRIAIMPVHIGGLACNMRRICAIARMHDCFIIEDAAHCQPLIGEGAAMNARGDSVVFSFYATKAISTVEGGMVIGTDNNHAAEMRLLRNHGMSKSLWDRTNTSHTSWLYDIHAHGYKYNLPDVLAAIGRVQLRKSPRNWQKRRTIADYYCQHLHDCPYITLPPHAIKHAQHHAWHLFLCQLNTAILTINRDTFISLMHAAGIQCSVHYIPLHMTRVHIADFGYQKNDFVRAATRYRNEVSLPIHPQLTTRMCAYIVRVIKNIGAEYAQ